jgi:hypothetical protein
LRRLQRRKNRRLIRLPGQEIGMVREAAERKAVAREVQIKFAMDAANLPFEVGNEQAEDEYSNEAVSGVGHGEVLARLPSGVTFQFGLNFGRSELGIRRALRHILRSNQRGLAPMK